MVGAVGMWSDLMVYNQGAARLSAVLTPTSTPKTEGVSQEKVKGGMQHTCMGPGDSGDQIYL